MNVLLTAVIFVTDKEHITDKPLGHRIRVFYWLTRLLHLKGN